MTALALGVFGLVLAAGIARGPRAFARPRPGLAAAAAALLALASTPFLFPAEHLLARALATGHAIALGVRVWSWCLGTPPRDPATLATRWRFALWLVLPFEPRWPRDRAAAPFARRSGAKRLLRAALKAGLLAGTVATKSAFGPEHPATWLCEGLEFYALLSGLADLVSGTVMVITGAALDEVFRAPLLASSPGDFWGRRWNLYISGFLRRHVFAPLAARGRVHAGLVASFVVSGLLHEYLVLAAMGAARFRPGYMLAFFALQAGAVLAWHALARTRRPSASTDRDVTGGPPNRDQPDALRAGLRALSLDTALHVLWIVVTARLFFAPLAPAIGAFDAACLAIGRAVARAVGIGG